MLDTAIGAHAAASAVELAAAAPLGLTPGRAWAFVGMGFAVAGLIAGIAAHRRSRRRGRDAGRVGAAIGVVAGAVASGFGTYVIAAAEGGPNTGYGVVGGFVALLAGLAAVALGVVVTVRSRRRAPSDAA